MNRGGNSYGFSGFSIGQVERMIGVKAHILRYWEEQIPLIRPQKDSLGRRFYSARDVSLLYRLKYLIYEKHYTALGAGEELLRELSSKAARSEKAIIIQEVRRDLMEVYGIVSRGRHRAESAGVQAAKSEGQARPADSAKES